MTLYGRLAVLLLAALLLVAQHEAASHAITHVGHPYAGTLQIGGDGSDHDCPDCARFAGWSVAVPPAQDALAVVPQDRAAPSFRTELRRSKAPRGPPRNRGPPLV